MAKKDGGWVKVRTSQDEKDRWEAVALSEEMTLSNLIRVRLNTVTVDRPPKKQRLTRQADPLLLSNIGRVGSNLNQIARWANTHKTAAEASEVLLALIAIENLIKEMAGAKTKAKTGGDSDAS